MQATVALPGLQGPLGTALDISFGRATSLCHGELSNAEADQPGLQLV